MGRFTNLVAFAVTSVILAACLMGCGGSMTPTNEFPGALDLTIMPSYWDTVKSMWMPASATELGGDHFVGPAGLWDFGVIRADSSVPATKDDVKAAGGSGIEPAWDIRDSAGAEAPIEGKAYKLVPGDWTVAATLSTGERLVIYLTTK